MLRKYLLPPILLSTSILILSLIASFISMSTGLAAGTYYVSTTGDDTNPGTQAQPWGSIQFGIEQLSPGDTLLVQDGTYDGQITLGNSGTEENPLSIQALNKGQVVINAQGHEYGFHIQGSSYVSIAGFIIEGADVANVLISGDVSYMSLQECDIRNSQIGVLVGCHGSCEHRQQGGDNLISNTKIHDNEAEGLYFYDGGFTLRGNEIYANGQSGLAMTSTEDNWLIEDNIIHDNGYKGVRNTNFGMVLDTMSYVQGHIIRGNEIYNSYGAGIYLGHNHVRVYGNDVHHNARNEVRDGHGIYIAGVEYCEVYGNKFHHNQNYNYSAGIRLGGDHNIVRNNEIYENDMGMYVVDGNHDHLRSARYNLVHNNVIYDNDITGIELNGAQHNEFYNNSLFGGDGWGISIVDGSYNTSSDNTFKNNIVFYTGLPEGWELIHIENGNDAGYIEDYNILYPDRSYFAGISDNLYTFSQYQAQTGQGIHSLNRDPLYVHPGDYDFHLRSDSPAINAGIDVGLPFTGSAPDMGAFEFGMSDLGEDINQDNNVDVLDLQLCAGVILGIEKDPLIVQRADVNGDGLVDSLDHDRIIRIVLEK